MYRVQIIEHNPSKMHLFYRDLRAVASCSPSLSSGGGACHAVTQATLSRVALPPVGGGMGSVNTSFLGLLFSGRFLCLLSESEQKRSFPTLCLRTERLPSVLQ